MKSIGLCACVFVCVWRRHRGVCVCHHGLLASKSQLMHILCLSLPSCLIEVGPSSAAQLRILNLFVLSSSLLSVVC